MRLLLLLTPLVLAACALSADPTPEALRSLPAGAWQLEKPHASLTFRVKHLGLSYYTARFADFDATLDFDPANPAAAKLTAIVNPMSVRTDHPTDAGWDAQLGGSLLGGNQFPQITFESTRVETTGETTGRVTGNLTLRGVTAPVTLDITYNGGMDRAVLYQGRAAVGFSAKGKLNRSAFGLTQYASFVGEEVEILIEAEFTKR